VAVDTVPENVSALKAEVAVLNELLAVYERVMVEQSAKLEHTLQEYREARDAAHASEARLRDLVATINDWIWETNVEGVYTYASPRVRDLLGYEPEEVVGRTPFDLMPQEEAKRLAPVFEELLAAKKPALSLENTCTHKDGHLVILETSGTPFFAPDGTLMGYRGVDRDITERKQMEKVLRVSEERFRVISEGSPHGILMADSKTRQFLYANPCMRQLLGYTEKELLQLGVADIHPKDSLDHVASEFESQARGEKTLASELPCLRKDGTVFYADVTSSIVILDGGQECVEGFFVDVTARKQAEEALREETDRNEQILQNAMDGFFVTGIDGELRHVNPAFCNTVGYSREELLQMRIQDIECQETSAETRRHIAQILETGHDRFETKHRRKDGQIVDLEVSANIAGEADGRYFAVFARDITERIRAEKEILLKNALLETQREASIDGILVVDDDGQMTSFNRRFVQMWGIPEDVIAFGSDERALEAIGDKLADPEGFLNRVRYLYEHANEESRDEVPLRDGRTFDRYSAPVIGQDGSYHGRVWSFRDITERKDAEGRLRRYARELKRANEEVKQFAYIVSHDLRGPLINLKGFAAELRSACSTVDSHLAAALPHLNEEQQREVGALLHQDIPEALEFIGASVTQMDSFINAVLMLSRLGRRELSFEKVDLREVVQGALKTLAHQIKECQVRVTVGSLPEVIGDRTAMEQMVGNILTNALNYLEPGRPGEIEVGGEQQGAETTFFVRDNGRGIAESDMPKVFALFRRAGRQDVKGEGMGLTYAQTLVHRHGGYIRCDSELGVGTTFTVVLSNHPEEERAGNAPTATG